MMKVAWIFGVMALYGAAFASATNLLVNGGFENELAPAWEKRTPEDAARRIFRAAGEGRSGAAAVLENLEPTFTRLRQGHDRSIKIEPGQRIELSAWIKTDMEAAGEAMLQFYCLDAKGGILAQPQSRRVTGPADWTFCRMRTTVPEGTAYVMPYLQTRGGVGKVWFDDVSLTLLPPPAPLPPEPRVVLFSDLPEEHAVIKNARTLFGAGLVKAGDDPASALADAEGALALYEGVPPGVWLALKGFAEKGGRVFMDIRAFAAAHGVEAVAVKVGDPASKNLQSVMRSGLTVLRSDDATAGFAVGQVMPRMGWPAGNLFMLPTGFSLAGLEILAEGPGGEPGLVKLAVGKGRVTACDLLSLREPYFRNIDAFYAFTPVSGALGNPPAFGEYYPQRMKYEGVVAEMRRLAEKYPEISLEDEGAASGGYRLWSLNLGGSGRPLYLLYAAAHGAEWEPGYGLMTFARQVADGRLSGVVDLEKVSIKIIPILNPAGYDKMSRQNANGVDLNRQGDHRWEHFKGRDSNNDGVWGPGDYDWKGTAPLSEPEAIAYNRISQMPELHCVLDFHANTSAKENRMGFLSATGHPDNEDLAENFQRIALLRLRGKHLLRQNDEPAVSQYLLDYVSMGSGSPFLMNTSAKGRFGMLIELNGIYRESYGTLLQTDVTCELCRALFIAYPPEREKSGNK